VAIQLPKPRPGVYVLTFTGTTTGTEFQVPLRLAKGKASIAWVD
jgi:hypothetical protein